MSERGIDLRRQSVLDRPLCIIAEIGSCHDGSLATAKALAKAAIDAGADVVKAQYFSSGKRLADRRHAPELAEMYEKYAMPREWLPQLAEYVAALRAEFACTSYLPEDVWEVFSHASIMKIASFEAADPEMLFCHREPLRRGRDVVISLGMGTTPEIIRRHFLDRIGGGADDGAVRGGRVRLLHCVSAYPAPIQQLALGRLSEHFVHGFSDHAHPSELYSGAFAAAAGAQVLEKHIRLDETRVGNPDFGHSLSPVQFAEYVRLARLGAAARGADLTTRHGPQPCEEPMLKYRVTR